jgi:hypothetical protein
MKMPVGVANAIATFWDDPHRAMCEFDSFGNPLSVQMVLTASGTARAIKK